MLRQPSKPFLVRTTSNITHHLVKLRSKASKKLRACTSASYYVVVVWLLRLVPLGSVRLLPPVDSHDIISPLSAPAANMSDDEQSLHSVSSQGTSPLGGRTNGRRNNSHNSRASQTRTTNRNPETGRARNDPNHDKPRLPHILTLYGRTNWEEIATTEQSAKAFNSAGSNWIIFCNSLTPYRSSHISPDSNRTFTELFGLCLYNQEIFTASAASAASTHDPPNPQAFDSGIVVQFFRWLTAQTDSKPSCFSKAKSFFNAHLRAEYKNRMAAAGLPNPHCPKVTVGSLHDVSRLCSQFQKALVQRDIDEMRDIHEHIDVFLSPQEIERLLTLVFEPVVGSQTGRLDATARIVFAASFTSHWGTVRRGDQHYKQYLYQRYAEFKPDVGPIGTQFTLIASQESKRSKGSRKELMGYLPHINPMQDPVPWHGLLWLHLFEVMRKPPPDFLDFKQFFTYATYPSSRPHGSDKEDDRVTAQNYRDYWTAHFADAQLSTTKITSITRVQGIQMMDDKCVPEPLASRTAGHRKEQHQSKARVENYLGNPPLASALCMAGGEWADKQAFVKPQRSVSVSDAAICAFRFGTHLVQQLAQVRQKMCGRSRAANLNERLVNAEALCELMIIEVKEALLMLSSRPLDPVTKALRRESPILYDRFRNSPTFRSLFNHPFFSSEHWQTIKNQVNTAENAVHVDYETLGTQTRNEMSSFCRSIQRTQRQQHIASQQQFHSICTRLDVMQQERALSGFAAQLPVTTPLLGESNNSPQQVVPIAASVVNATNISGTKKVAIGEEFILGAEPNVEGEPSRISLKECDAHFNSAQEYYDLWENTFKPLEEKGIVWRTDRSFMAQDDSGSVRIVEARNARNTWFSSRRIIWEYIDYLREKKGYSREDAIAEAEKVYDSARTGNNQTVNRKLMTKKFANAYKAAGGTGRKPGRKRNQDTVRQTGCYKRIRESTERTLAAMNFGARSIPGNQPTGSTATPARTNHGRPGNGHLVATGNRRPMYWGHYTDPVVFRQAFQETPLTTEEIEEIRNNVRRQDEHCQANLERRAAEERWRSVESEVEGPLYGGFVPTGCPEMPKHRFSTHYGALVFPPQQYRLQQSLLPPPTQPPIDGNIGDSIPEDMVTGFYGGQ